MAPQYFYIVSQRSGKVLHVKNALTTDNAEIVQFTKSGGNNQKWALEPDISDVLKNETTNSLDISGSVLTSTVNGVSATIDIGSIIADILYIQTGTKLDGASESLNWTLNTGIGKRTYTAAVKFDSPFRVPPKVSLALSGQDVNEAKNNRIHLIAENITVDGFDLVYETWSDTVLHRIWATWTAIGLKP
jgi:hypothetical protein